MDAKDKYDIIAVILVVGSGLHDAPISSMMVGTGLALAIVTFLARWKGL